MYIMIVFSLDFYPAKEPNEGQETIIKLRRDGH